MKKYLLVLADGSESIAFSEENYRIGQPFGWIGIVKSILSIEMIIEKYYLEIHSKLCQSLTKLLEMSIHVCYENIKLCESKRNKKKKKGIFKW